MDTQAVADVLINMRDTLIMRDLLAADVRTLTMDELFIRGEIEYRKRGKRTPLGIFTAKQPNE